MKNRKRIYLPLMGRPVCGHSKIMFENCLGREEGSLVIRSRRGIDFIAPIEYGACEKCNKAQIKRYKKMAKAYGKTQKQ